MDDRLWPRRPCGTQGEAQSLIQGPGPRLCSPSQDRTTRDVLTGTVLAEPWGGVRRGQGLPGRTGQEHPLGARPVARRAFTVEGPTGWRCHDTRLYRHCPAMKPTGSEACLRGSRAVPHSSGFPVGKGSRQPWWLQSQCWEGCLWPQMARWGMLAHRGSAPCLPTALSPKGQLPCSCSPDPGGATGAPEGQCPQSPPRPLLLAAATDSRLTTHWVRRDTPEPQGQV